MKSGLSAWHKSGTGLNVADAEAIAASSLMGGGMLEGSNSSSATGMARALGAQWSRVVASMNSSWLRQTSLAEACWQQQQQCHKHMTQTQGVQGLKDSREHLYTHTGKRQRGFARSNKVAGGANGQHAQGIEDGKCGLTCSPRGPTCHSLIPASTENWPQQPDPPSGEVPWTCS
eukprot:scaffold184658_cov15-Tisochrysis_lutea.AAC.1